MLWLLAIILSPIDMPLSRCYIIIIIWLANAKMAYYNLQLCIATVMMNHCFNCPLTLLLVPIDP